MPEEAPRPPTATALAGEPHPLALEDASAHIGFWGSNSNPVKNPVSLS